MKARVGSYQCNERAEVVLSIMNIVTHRLHVCCCPAPGCRTLQVITRYQDIWPVAQEALQTRENQDLISGGGDGSPRLCPRVCLEIPLVSLVRGGGDGQAMVHSGSRDQSLMSQLAWV